jgi:thiol-disulfide isomerase/thioredoxin
MKTIVLNLTFITIAFCSSAQTCVLSGTVKDTAIKELQLALLYADSYENTFAIHLKVSPDGRFKQLIELPHPVFAILTTPTLRRRLLLTAGRDLQLGIDTGRNTTITYSGKAAIENELVHNSILDSTPFFMKGIWREDKQAYEEAMPYTRVTTGGFRDTIMNRVEQEIAHTRRRIQKTAIPAALKTILLSETHYAYQCFLNEFTRNNLAWASNPHKDSLLTWVMQWKPLPDSMALISGHFANMMLNRHGQYAFQLIGKNKEGGKEGLKARVSAYTGIPFNTFDSLMKVHGQVAIMGWLYAQRDLPTNVQDKMLFNKIIEAADGGHVSTMQFLLQQMKKTHPNSNYMAGAEALMQRMDHALKRNAGNAYIIYKSAAGIRSLSDLVKPYAGKIVYLDIWGTWCGPCKNEMPYVHALKQKYTGKDIVFVYLDMDDRSKETAWKEYVQVAALEGEHYRMDQDEIKPIWHDLQAAGGQRLDIYPTYVIIDKQGKIIHADAERPSSRQKLYAQLDKLL